MTRSVGVIPAAGEGRRMCPYSDVVPKQLIMYGDKPVIHHILEMFKEVEVNQVVLVVNDIEGPIPNYVRNGSWLDMDVRYAVQEKPLGVAHALLCAQTQLIETLNADKIVHVNGDRLVNPSSVLQDLFESHSKQKRLSTFLVTKVSDPSAYGGLEVDSDTMRIRQIVEKPTKPQQQKLKLPNGGYLTTTGVYVHSPRFLEYLSKMEYGPTKGENQLVKACNEAIADGETISAALLDCEMEDFGTPENYLHAQWKFFNSIAEQHIARMSSEWKKLATDRSSISSK
ncbi:MAG: nucleotidyltransferase family protein [Candidatus Thorarchaeota archaeon]|nr:nucleotidyltransferase family protein [Candidatus Thorarchaeota archaeon]